MSEQPQTQEQQPQQPTFPMLQVTIAPNAIVLKTFLSSTFSIEQILVEEQVNGILQEWLKTRQQIAAQQQIVTEAMLRKDLKVRGQR